MVCDDSQLHPQCASCSNNSSHLYDDSGTTSNHSNNPPDNDCSDWYNRHNRASADNDCSDWYNRHNRAGADNFGSNTPTEYDDGCIDECHPNNNKQCKHDNRSGD